MRFSTSFIPTVKEIPTDAQIPSHQLMIRAGMVRSLAAGVYVFLPLGSGSCRRSVQIVREEMDADRRAGVHLPALSPVELWEQTGRVKAFGDTLFHLKNRPLVLAPTHEEVVCWLAKNHVKSYKDMPQIWYQIQTKFRNEPRPRSGVLRGRQFMMKDSYSLDRSWEGLDQALRSPCRGVQEDLHPLRNPVLHRGRIERSDGGDRFPGIHDGVGLRGGCLALSEDGSLRRQSGSCHVRRARAPRARAGKPAMEEIHTPGVKTIDELAGFLKVDTAVLAKSVVYWAGEDPGPGPDDGERRL